ncbi:hypothetical protein CBS115989_4338 [Aspergillus niger]|uniref:ImpB/mucB/samB family protein n=1 Tax=Aspergillus niger TaxID=5061 RepID=A0A3F3RDP6_ASPNG|nr:hypothetical protein CBS115989_4338 [Aspergillus niger]KAI2829341.1 hypothetical protein CBS133816_4617 [Aspergillus niger]KAI2834948.1 hypothetical protein CBS11350_10383 [Aspergillus niger]KAI2838091.1 hypothetical protein CBS11232_9739 [Aspergillus niger]KAI2849445.1 hypothetical protein CBS12448_8888 [Aspergillus niger]
MSLLALPTELLQQVAALLPDGHLSSLLQVNLHLYDVLLPCLYQRRHKSRDFARSWPAGFMRAIATGNVQGTQNFLHYGADVNLVCSHHFLHQAKVPIEPWFDLQTPLNVAASIGNDTLVMMLLGHGAEINGLKHHDGVRFRHTQPAIADALLSGHISTVRLLLEHGSDIQDCHIEAGRLVLYAVNTGQLTMLQLLKEFGADLNIAYNHVEPLHKAACLRQISTDIVRFLLDHGAEITSSDRRHRRFMEDVMRGGTIDTARLLLERGAVFPQDGFHSAIACGTPDFIRLLIEYGHKPDIEWLKWAIRSRRLDLLQLLLEEGVGLYSRDARGSTILHYAVKWCSYESPTHGMSQAICGIPAQTPLVRRIKNIEPQTVSRPCSIQGTSRGTSEDILRYVIHRGAEINALDGNGRTPLDIARKYAPKVEQILVDSGATSHSNFQGGRESG